MTGWRIVEWQRRLARLRAAARRLDAAVRTADVVVRELERLLAGWRLEVSTEPEAFLEGEAVAAGQPVQVLLSLCWGPLAGRHRVYILEERGQVDEGGGWVLAVAPTVTPWFACRRELRLRAFSRLPDLLDAIAREAEGSVVEIEAAARAVAPLVGPRRGPPR